MEFQPSTLSYLKFVIEGNFINVHPGNDGGFVGKGDFRLSIFLGQTAKGLILTGLLLLVSGMVRVSKSFLLNEFSWTSLFAAWKTGCDVNFHQCYP